MARPYSIDLRERVVAAVSSGRSCREVASLFDVSVASVVKWSQRYRATGSAAAKPMGGHRKRLLEPHRAFVIGRLKAVPDLTLKALVAELAERGIATCPVSVWRQDCQEFRVWAGIMGKKESHYVPTQRTCDPV